MRTVPNDSDTHLALRSDTGPGESWETHFAALRRQLPRVRAALAHGGPSTAEEPMTLGLGLSPRALESLERVPARARLRAWLHEERCRIRTLDLVAGHAPPTTPTDEGHDAAGAGSVTLDLACRLATLLARLDPPGAHGSIGVHHGARAAAGDPARRAATVENLLRAVTRCVALERESGVRISLALAPPPDRPLETSLESVELIEAEVLATRSVQRLAALADLSAPAARHALHRHVGVWHDVCRSALAFEPPGASLDACASAGIAIVRLRLGSALRLDDINEAALRRLARFDEPGRSRTVIERRGATLVHHVGLDVAMEGARHRLERRSTLDASTRVPASVGLGAGVVRLPAVIEPACEWRVDVPVPLCIERAGPFPSTRSALADVLARQRERVVCPHLELRSCISDALPGRLDEMPPAIATARDLEWVRERL